MAAINFPNSPTQGDTFTANDKTWVYLDGKWTFQTGETPLPINVGSATSGQFLKWNGSAWVNDTIDLGADTAGSFVASLVAGTGVTLANNSGEASTPTVAIGQAVATNSNVTFNDVTVSGNLTVSGTTTSINTETLTVDDNIIVLNNNATGAPSQNAGIEVERGSSTNVALRWNETSDKWELTNDGSTYADIATETYAASLTPATLDAIGDVNITSASVGQTIQWNGSAWVNVTPTGTTVTTTANRSTDIPSPFIGQLIVLTDTKKVQLWDGTSWLNITMAPPETPTSLSAIASPTSVAISFTAGSANGSAITNYKYALSTDGGSTYGSFIALDPVDIATPITISGLSMNTTYHVKLKAVNDLGDSVASSAVSFTTEGVPNPPTSLSASNITGSTADIAFTAGAANGASITNYKFAVSTDDITYGAFSALSPADASTPITVTGLTSGTLQYIKLKAVNSNGDSAASAAVSFTTLATFTGQTLLVAGGQAGTGQTANSGGGWGGGGGGSSYNGSRTFTLGDSYSVVVGGAGTSTTMTGATTANTGSGQTAGSGGGNGGSGGGGGGANGSAYSIVGSSTYYGGGGGGGIAFGGTPGGPGGAGGGGVGATDFGGGGSGQPNSGGGGGGSSGYPNSNGGGGSGVVILRYPNIHTITLGAGLTGTTTTVSSDKLTTITAGSGNVSWA